LRQIRPIQTRFRYGSGCTSLNLATKSNSPAHSPKGTPSDLPAACPKARSQTWHSPSTACRHTVSGSFHSLNKGSFHLSLTVLVHYRSPRVFSLGRWTSLLPTGLACPVVLKVTSRSLDPFRLRGYHPLCPAIPDSSTTDQIGNSLGFSSSPNWALQPLRNIGTGPLSCAGLGFSLFARHYSGNDLSSSGY
jgi:hypothetical protein